MIESLDGWVEPYRAKIAAERGNIDPIDMEVQKSMGSGPLSLLRNVYDVYKDNAYSALFGMAPKGYLEGNVLQNLYAGTEDGKGLKYMADNDRFVVPGKDGEYVRAKNAKAYALDEKGNVLSEGDLDRTDDIVIEMETPDGAKIQVSYFDLVSTGLKEDPHSQRETAYLGVGEAYLLNPWGEAVAKGLNVYSSHFAEMDMPLNPVGRKSWSSKDSEYHEGVRVKRQPYTPVFDTDKGTFEWMEPVTNPRVTGGHEFEKKEGVFKYLAS